MFSCSSVCRPLNLDADTVKIDMETLAARRAAAERLIHEQQRYMQELEREEREAALRMEQQAEADRLAKEQAAEDRRLAKERLRLQVEEERRAEEARVAEEQRLEKEKADAAAAKLREDKRLAAERQRVQAEQVRKAEIAGFLKTEGFNILAGSKASKRSILRGTTYPLHCAVSSGNVRIVRLLLEDGVDKTQKNSAGKTAIQLAESKRSKSPTYDTIARLLSSGVSSVGGA